MLVKTKAIVINCIPYNDSTNIVHLYTDQYGMASYLVSNPKSRKSGLKRAFFQPFTLIEIDADYKGSRQLQRIKDVRCLYPCTDISCNPVKNTVTLFLAEVLIRSLREAEKNPAMFDYLFQSVQLLDLCEKGLANFHIVFLIKLTRYLGFYPNLDNAGRGWYFDLAGGEFVPVCPTHNAWLNPVEAKDFAKLMQINFENMQDFGFEHNQRADLLSNILKYYKMHLVDFPAIKSLEVLKEVFAV